VLCKECKQEPAVVHITQYVNGQSTTKQLCEGCARKEGYQFGEQFLSNFSIKNLLSGLLDMQIGSEDKAGRLLDSSQGERCTQCGQDFLRFHRTGRLGCAGCYQAFSHHLEPLLKRVQGAVKHQGKLPQRGGKKVQLFRQISDLKRSLQLSIAEERYEEAASLRDLIRAMEKEAEVS